jgi:hypothetical protein
MEYRDDHQVETEAGIEDHAAAGVASVYKKYFFLLKRTASRDGFGF